MSQKTARATRRKPARVNGQPLAPQETPQEVLEASPENTPPQPPGAVVFRIPTENPGEVLIDIQEINGLDPFAVPSLLRAAANIKEKQLNAGGANNG